jgi:type IV pilus assembly protein PilC
MPKFSYIARDTTGKKITGVEEAGSQEEIVGRLQAKDLIVVNIVSDHKEGAPAFKEEGQRKAKFRPQHSGVKDEDLTLFCRQLATLLGAGVTILKSLDIISQQVSSRKLQQVLRDLQRNMEAGVSLHETMAKHPKVFNELWVNLVESGEASGNLAIILSRLANYLERMEAFKRKVISALIYPVILTVAGLGALLFLSVKIIPTFAELFKGFNVELPALTKILLVISSTLRRYMLVGLVGSTILFFLFRKYTRSGEGRRQWERFKFDMPVLGDFFHALILERFSSEMSTLVESGVPILYSLEIAERSVGNVIVGDIIRKIKEDVREGKPLSQPLEKSGFFEPMFVQMVAIGEEIGELSQMFKKINAFYQEYVETFLTRFTAMFEPLMLIFMGVVIGVMVIGMFLPIFQISKIGGSN